MPAEPVQPLHVPTSPARAVDDATALFSAGQIAGAALLGTPITAGLLWSANARVLGWRRPWLGVVIGALATILPIALLTCVPPRQGMVRWAIGIIVLLAWPLLADIAGTAFARVAVRPRRGHGSVVAVIVVVVGALLGIEQLANVRGAVVPRSFLLPEPSPAQAGAVSVAYDLHVERADAERAALFLDQAGFARQGRLWVRLGRNGDFVARVRVPGPVDDQVVALGRQLGRALADGLGACVTTSLVRADDDRPLASGRSCPGR